jgi:hypothetical protein
MKTSECIMGQSDHIFGGFYSPNRVIPINMGTPIHQYGKLLKSVISAPNCFDGLGTYDERISLQKQLSDLAQWSVRCAVLAISLRKRNSHFSYFPQKNQHCGNSSAKR